MGAAYPVKYNKVFNEQTKVYLKEVSPIQINEHVRQLIISNDKTLVANIAFGKGQVIAVGDPWLYNEYVDGRKLPIGFQNFEAMQQLVQWAISKTK
jgi:unsaturated rhamnogalacturonyl hydrolase